MKNIIILLISTFLFLSCKDNNLNSKNNKSLNIKNDELSYSNTEDLIQQYKDFELNGNQDFQQDLELKSKDYYENKIKEFTEEETGFFRLFGELWDTPFKSENERKTLWKLKIDRYFRTTAYLAYIRKEIDIYTDGVNNQRNNGVSKILGNKTSSNLKLPLVDTNYFTSKNETVERIISKINQEIIDQLTDTVLGFSLEIIFSILSTYLAIKGFKLHWSISIIIFIILGVFFYWRSHKRQNEIKEILKTECTKALNSTKIDYLEQLNNNTINYYSQFQKINYETNK